MAKFVPTVEVNIDLSKPVEELAQVISYVLMSSPVESHKGILEGLDMEVGNALAAIQKSEIEQEKQETKEEK